MIADDRLMIVDDRLMIGIVTTTTTTVWYMIYDINHEYSDQ